MNKLLIIKLLHHGPELVFASKSDNQISALPMSLPFGFWGHYDWLRKDKHNVLGVRWSSNDYEFPGDHSRFFAVIKSLGYCKWEAPGILTLFFSSERCFIESLSQDQELDSSTILAPSGDVDHFSLVFRNPPEGFYQRGFDACLETFEYKG